jgi:aminopeptidase N
MKRNRDNIFGMEKRTPGVAVVHDNLPEIRGGRAPVQIVYQKGGWVLHALRGVIGTEKFWQGIREYYRQYRDSNASTDDLRRVMEEASGRDLRWFFQQWLYRAGSPAVESAWRYDATAKKVELTITQTQAGDAFRLPIDVAVDGRVERIDVTEKSQKFQLSAEKAPGAVVVDPATWVLMDAKR